MSIVVHVVDAYVMLAGLLSSVVAGGMSYAGQQSANVASEEIAGQTNATQINLADTAIQRRVADYKAAGLNPMLAAGGPGAMGISPVMPNIQNPAASMPNIAQQVTGAMSAKAQIDNTNANTRLVQAQTPGDVVALDKDGNPDWTRATGGTLGNLSAAQLSQSIKNAQATWEDIQQSIALKGKQISQVDLQNQLSTLTVGQQKALYQAVIAQGLAESRIEQANVPAAEAAGKLMEGNRGVVIETLQKVLGIAGAGVGLAGGIAKLGTQTIEKSLIGPQGQYRGGSVTTQ